MSQLKINIAKSTGFCFGVKRAIDIALATAKGSKKVVMLGDIVHNETVIKEITKAGIKKINNLNGHSPATLIVRAHGTSAAIYSKAHSLGYSIVDATCPMVKEIHRLAITFEKQGYKIIIIGDRNHDEVKGITGQLSGKALVLNRLKKLPEKSLKKIKKACLLIQSTQNLSEVVEAANRIKQHIPNLKFFNTICQPTRSKQKEIRTMPLANDLMIIIGSRSSANTRRLYEISYSINKRSYWIESAQDLRMEWFRGVKNVGIATGASTPAATLQKVISRIKKIPVNFKPLSATNRQRSAKKR